MSVGLIPAEVFLPLRIEQGIGSIGIEERQLNCFLTRAIQELSIDCPCIGINFFQLTYTVGILPLDGVKFQGLPQRGGILRRLICPIRLNRFLEIIGQSLCVGIPILDN